MWVIEKDAEEDNETKDEKESKEDEGDLWKNVHCLLNV